MKLIQPVRLIAFALAATCLSPASATTFLPGQYVSYSQDDWGGPAAPGNAAQFLTTNFDTLYAGTGVEVGIIGPSGFSMAFETAASAIAYLPSTGSPDALDNDYDDAFVTSSGEFGGEVLSLRFNVAFSDSGALGTAPTKFGDLILFNYGAAALNGLTVRQILAQAEIALGKGVTPVPLAVLDAATFDLNNSFENGAVSTFAEQHLKLPATSVPEPETWALMLIGFGAVGVSIRNRNLTVRPV